LPAKPIFAGKNYFCRTIFASPVFTAEKTGFFPPSGKNLPTLMSFNYFFRKMQRNTAIVKQG